MDVLDRCFGNYFPTWIDFKVHKTTVNRVSNNIRIGKPVVWLEGKAKLMVVIEAFDIVEENKTFYFLFFTFKQALFEQRRPLNQIHPVVAIVNFHFLAVFNK